MTNFHGLTDIPRRFPETDPGREERIDNEIIVDAYGDEGIASSWYYYLEEKLRFPFKAMVLTHRYRPGPKSVATSVSQVELIGMAPLSRCGYHQMWAMGVLSLRRDAPLHFFLSDIIEIEPEEERETALTDWVYWNREQLAEIWEQ